MARVSKQQSSSDEPKKTRRQRRPEMSPEKREFLRSFVGMYDIKTAADLALVNKNESLPQSV